MTASWISLVGLYLLIGTMVSGLNLIARIRLQGYAEPIFPNWRAAILFGTGVAIGVLFWPVVILLIPVIQAAVRRRVKRRLAEIQRRIDEARPPILPPKREISEAPIFYVCQNCGARHFGSPPGFDHDRKALCIRCRR